MGKYIIVSKYPKGNNRFKDYDVKFQIKEIGSPVYTIQMCCMDDKKPKYAFFDNHNKNLDLITDRGDFLEEFYKFQKGGSYRKANPIIQPNLDNLLQTKKELQRQIENIDTQLSYCKEELNKKKVQEYYKDIDLDDDEYKTYMESVYSLINNTKFSIRPYYSVDTLYIVDNKSQKLLTILQLGENSNFLKDVDSSDIDRYENHIK